MNRLIKYLFFLPVISLTAQTGSLHPGENITEIYYRSSDYIRSDLFLEQDLIYGRDVDFSQGLELICLQDKVKVEISKYGTLYTPLDLDGIPTGNYTVKLSKRGFHTIEFQIGISSDKRTSVIVNLVPLTGRLVVDGLPENALVYINNHKVNPLEGELAIGKNYLRISAFGYEDFTDLLDYTGESEVIYRPELIKKDFHLSEVTLSREILWTNDSRSQKISRISIYADAPGTGSITITRSSDNTVVENADINFEKSKTVYFFDLNKYPSVSEDSFSVLVKGSDNANSSGIEKFIQVKEGNKSVWRNNFKGYSGFLFLPSAETLPRGITQLHTSVSPVFSRNSIDSLYTPAIFSIRTSFLKNLELSLGMGLYVSHLQNETSLDLFASGKFSFLTSDGFKGLSIAAGLSLNYNGKVSSFGEIPAYDPFGGLSGLSLVLPVKYSFGKISIHFAPELQISPSSPGTESQGFSEGTVFMWNYFKTAISLDSGSFSAALSAALQSPLYDGSYGKWPLFVGLDFNTTPGDTGFSLSLFSGFRYVAGEKTMITSGVSVGFIF